MIHTILFAMDLGVHTPLLIHHVNSLASKHSVDIYVVHIVEPLGHMADAVMGVYLSHESRQELEQTGIKAILTEVKSRIIDLLEDHFVDGQNGLGNIRDVRVIPGQPVDTILDQAEQLNADMIVVGSHGNRNREAHVLGSVTQRLLQMSRVPVLMVPLLRDVNSISETG